MEIFAMHLQNLRDLLITDQWHLSEIKHYRTIVNRTSRRSLRKGANLEPKAALASGLSMTERPQGQQLSKKQELDNHTGEF